jgi:hypothetical protein
VSLSLIHLTDYFIRRRFFLKRLWATEGISHGMQPCKAFSHLRIKQPEMHMGYRLWASMGSGPLLEHIFHQNDYTKVQNAKPVTFSAPRSGAQSQRPWAAGSFQHYHKTTKPSALFILKL